MQFSLFKKITRLEQALFGLPFVLSGALLPFITEALPWQFQLRWLWILPAFFSARFSGMIFNQVIDHKIDGENFRTKDRLIASNVIQSTLAWKMAFGFLALFLLCCSQINRMTFFFSLGASILLIGYSYTKRFTSACHFILGLIHFLGPLMTWVALSGKITWTPIFMGLIPMTLIIGSDVIYALQDLAFDRSKGLHSIPVRLGVQGTKLIAQLLHLLTLFFLLFLGLSADFSWHYYLSLIAASTFFLLFHLKIEKREHFEGIEPLFFTCTSGIALSTFIFIIGEAL